MAKDDQALASHLAKELANARDALEVAMETYGMRLKDGWRIAEEIRHTVEGTDFIFRPIHLRLEPPDMERRVSIDHEGHLV
jgi:hypothetical protein